MVSPQIINRACRIKAGPVYKIPSIFSPGGVSLAIRGWYVPTHSGNPNCRLLFHMNIYRENVSKYPPEFLHISLFSERPLSIINRAIRGGYSRELLVEFIVPFAKSLLQILYQLNTYNANVRVLPGEFRCHDDKHDQLTW